MNGERIERRRFRAGAEFVRDRIQSGVAKRIALLGHSAAHCQHAMVATLISVCPDDDKPAYEPSKRRLIWPNGAIATCYTTNEPDNLRGAQFDTAWADVIDNARPDAWRNLLFGLRLGDDARAVVTKEETAEREKTQGVEKRLEQICRAGHIPGDTGPAGIMAHPSLLGQQVLRVAEASGYEVEEILDGLSGFLGLTGDLYTGRRLLDRLMVLSRETGRGFRETARAAGRVCNQMGRVPDRAAATERMLRAAWGADRWPVKS